MKVVSWNVNGLRAASKKGFLEFFNSVKADIFCLQEIKAQEGQLTSNIVNPQGYYSFFNSAQKKGYSGVAVYSKQRPLDIRYSLGHERFDSEGRMLILEYPNLVLINIYIPHGGRLKDKMNYKLEVYKRLFNTLDELKNKSIIIAGDFNIAHKEIDLARPTQNRNNTMFTPKEKHQIDVLLDMGFVDGFRKFCKEGSNYTWWPYAYDARRRNMGWRIDYVFVSRKLFNNLKRASIYPDIKGSDHCPIGLELAVK